MNVDPTTNLSLELSRVRRQVYFALAAIMLLGMAQVFSALTLLEQRRVLDDHQKGLVWAIGWIDYWKQQPASAKQDTK